MGYYRNPRCKGKKQEAGVIDPDMVFYRVRTRPKYVWDSWDDLKKSYTKSWKAKRKRQYKA